MKTIAFILFALPSFALANLETSLEVVRVVHSQTNQIASGSPSSETCSNFKGTFDGNTVVLKPVASGGSGRYSHQLVWTLSESYKTFDGVQTQKQVYVRNGNTYYLNLPQLKDEVSWVQQPVFVITTDLKTKQTATKQLLFNVTRPVVLTPSQNQERLSRGCFQVFPAFESVAGILSNGSTNPSQILIRQGIQNIWSKTSGSQWGFFFSPLAWTVVGNVFSINRSYFNQFSRQTIETVEVSSGYTLTPGDFVQLYEQRTRYIQVFDAKIINGCGESQELDGEYFLQWWGVAYHAVPVNPYENESAPIETIGARPVNHCPDELTPEFARDENGSFIFSRTL